jgi:hypothetical protein
MWNKVLIMGVGAYHSAVLTVVEPSGYPISVRCTVHCDEAHEYITFPTLPALATGWRGLAALLLHRHDAELEEQHELLIKGDLAEEDGQLCLRPSDFLTGTGSPKTDQMPHAGDPIELVRFMLLGQRKAREYLAKRGAPWDPIRFDLLLKALDERTPS